MPTTAPVPACEILLDGAPLDQEIMNRLIDVHVRNSVLLPDTAVVRIQDPRGDLVTQDKFTVSAAVEVKFAATAKDVLTSAFKGEIVAIEPEWGPGNLVVSFRAYDKAWRLNRTRKSRTWTNASAADMLKQVGGDVGLRPNVVIAGSTVYEFFQQSMETDWEFCWRLARMHNCEFSVSGDTYNFRPREPASSVATLDWSGNEPQLLTFKPRLTGVGQVQSVVVRNHDPKSKQSVTAAASTPTLPHKSDAVGTRGSTVAKLNAGEVIVANHIADSMTEAQDLAQSTLNRLSSSFVEAEGSAWGNPLVRAGSTVTIKDVGKFSGDYALSETTHRFGGRGTQYVTSFVISGRTSHTFRDLLRPSGATDWASSLVIGIITNNNDDKQQLGRVKVKFPGLGDNIESGWARVVTPNAGTDRGMFYIPQVGDEVVVAFEHGDTRRPLIIGSLFNGKDKPHADLMDPASGTPDKKALFGVKTPHEAFVESTQKMTLRSHETMIVEVKKDGQKGTGDYTLDAAGMIETKAGSNAKHTAATEYVIDAGSSVTIKGKGSVTVEAGAGLTLKGATVDITASGPVNVKGATINLG